jgi:hypothetical protein
MAEVTYYVALPFVASDDGICRWRAHRMLQSYRRRDVRPSAITQGGSCRRGSTNPDKGFRRHRRRERQ